MKTESVKTCDLIESFHTFSYKMVRD